MDKMREEFEAWANERGLDVDHIYVNGCFKCYCVSHTQSAFYIWKASRAAMCVELPSFENGSIRGHSGDCDEARMIVDSVAESLDNAGVSYK